MAAEVIEPGRFMVATSAVIEHIPTGDVLMVRRAPGADFAAGLWEDISGRMHQGEDPETALRREIREETGIRELEVVGPLRAWHAYRGEQTSVTELVGIAYWCRTAVREVRLSPEHVETRWVSAEEALTMAGTDGIRASIEAFMRTRVEAPQELAGTAD